MTLYLSHFTASLFITDRHKWTSPRGDVSVNSPDDPLPFLPSVSHQPGPTVSPPDGSFPLKLLQLEPTNYQHVQSAERSTERENTNHKVQVQHYSVVLYCFVPAPDSLLLHAGRFHETDPGMPPSTVLW